MNLDPPIPYLQRVRSYYQGLGYGAPYEWAQFAEVPFHPLTQPLSQCRVGLVTTAHEHDLRIAHVAIDRHHTTATDQASYFPLAALRRAAASWRAAKPMRWTLWCWCPTAR